MTVLFMFGLFFKIASKIHKNFVALQIIRAFFLKFLFKAEGYSFLKSYRIRVSAVYVYFASMRIQL